MPKHNLRAYHGLLRKFRPRTQPRTEARGLACAMPACVEGLEDRLLMARIAGIDVSHYQGSINWTSVKNAGITFAFTKATEGTTYTDPYFATNMTAAKNAGVLIGAYDFARYDSNPGVAGADAEAAYFWARYRTYAVATGTYMVPVLDIENTASNTPSSAGYTKTTLSQWAHEWLTVIQNDAAAIGITLTPLVYSGASFAQTWLDSTIAQSFPAWIANYNGQSPDTGSPNYSSGGVSPWQSPNGWQFWQYSSSGTVSGISGAVDQDVFKGSTYDLRDYVLGAPPRWAANSRVVTNSSVTAWATSAANTTSTAVASGVYGKIVNAVPVFGNSFWRWQVQFDNGVSGWVGEDFLNTATPSQAGSPSPGNTTLSWLTSAPASFSWSGSNATSYDVYLDAAKKATVTTNNWTPGAITDGVHSWRVDAKNAELTTTGATWNFKLDANAPLASYGGQTPTRGASSFTFTVTYTDNASGVDYTSLDSSDLLVTGPNGYSQTPTLVSLDAQASGPTRIATYSITPPDGAWSENDNGSYTIAQVAGQVKDVAGNVRPASTVGSFSLGLPFAYSAGSTVVVDFAAPGETISLTNSAGTLTASDGTTSYNFPGASVTGITVNTSPGNDTLSLAGALPAMILSGAGGANAINVTSGSADLESDAAGYAVSVSGGASLTFGVRQHLASLTISGGSVTLPAGTSTPLLTANLSISSGGKLDLNDNELFWDYSGASPIATLRSYLQSGRNGGTWDGAGIASSTAAGAGNNAALGYLEASDLGVTRFDGQTVDSTTLIVKSTVAGDANLDGVINGDDYALIDRAFAKGLTSGAAYWTSGDFDYDGAVTAADYLLIDKSAALASGMPSPSMLAMREAQFGPAYVAALETALAPATSSTPPAAPASSTSTTSSPTLFATDPIIPPTAVPVATLTGPHQVKRGRAARFHLGSTGATAGAPITYRIDWNGDGKVDQAVTATGPIDLVHRFAHKGRDSVTLWLVDAAGGVSDPVSLLVRVV